MAKIIVGILVLSVLLTPLVGADWWGENFYAILLTMRIVCGGPLLSRFDKEVA
jgi:hypothetical protein